MSKFVTKLLETVKGRQKYEELVILPNNVNVTTVNINEVKGVLDLYEESLEKAYKKSFSKILNYMNQEANLILLPREKFRDLTPAGDTVKEYEFKHGDLRVYAIKIPNGKLVILGGYKNNQPKDISHFRSIKEQYLNSLK